MHEIDLAVGFYCCLLVSMFLNSIGHICLYWSLWVLLVSLVFYWSYWSYRPIGFYWAYWFLLVLLVSIGPIGPIGFYWSYWFLFILLRLVSLHNAPYRQSQQPNMLECYLKKIVKNKNKKKNIFCLNEKHTPPPTYVFTSSFIGILMSH